jgi:ABC-2 type transport system ATP-binding protein
MNTPFISIKGLHKAFGATQVLRGLDLQAGRGEVIGILGRNGAGKTTLFKLLLDLLERDAGNITLGGKSPDGTGAIRFSIGYVPERPAFHPWMTGHEVLSFRAGFYPAWSMEKALATAKRLELPLDKKVSVFSKGNLAKLAWCCAVAPDPDLLLLDEPTSGLDYLIKDKILDGLIGELTSAKKTVLIASHVMEDALNLVDKLALLSGGTISEVHKAEKLKTEAFMVNARLKPGSGYGGDAVKLSAEGPLVTFGVIGRDKMEALLKEEAFETAEHRPMSMSETFRTLLHGTKEEL